MEPEQSRASNGIDRDVIAICPYCVKSARRPIYATDPPGTRYVIATCLKCTDSTHRAFEPVRFLGHDGMRVQG
jgi:hypothetical protein